MWTILILVAFCILGLYFYLPMPMVVILFAALISGSAATLWFAWTKRRQPVRVEAVVKPETDSNS